MGIDEWTEGVEEHRSGGNALYTRLPKLTVVTQGVILCPVDSGLGKNLEVRPS